MKIPLINATPSLHAAVSRLLAAANGHPRQAESLGGRAQPFELVAWDDKEQACEYIDYEMPPLLLLNFSAGAIDAFELMDRILADPWLHYGGIIALYAGVDAYQRISALKDSNIIVHLHHHDIERQLGTVLDIVRSNEQILFQRALQTELLPSVSGEFVLDQNLLLVPAYANLVANYLFNVGFLDSEAKAGVSLVLAEILINAIEHGNCGIDSAEKRAYLAGHSSIEGLITEKCGEPAIRERRVYYRYDIDVERSIHVIRDEGAGFDWRSQMAADALDPLAESGRGLVLAAHIADRIAYNEVGNEVTLEFRHTSGNATIPGLLRTNEVLECRPGDVIFNQGEASDHLYYVAAGEFHVIANGRHVANLTPADLLMGEMAVLLEETRTATVVAHSPGRLIKISKQDFIRIIKEQPYFGLFLSRMMARRLHRLSHGVL